MSLDLWLEVNTGGPCPAIVGNDNLNFTHNVNPMWIELFGMSLGAFLEDTRAEVVQKELCVALEVMKDNPERFKALNPPNGWGDYESAMQFLERVIQNGKLHPWAIWRADR